MSTQVVILAAGQGKRMFSDLPKVLHPLAGKPLLSHVIETASTLTDKKPLVIFGHQGNILRDHLAHHDVQWVEQTEQLGTGHALLQALPMMSDKDRVLVLYGDVPFISIDTLKKLIDTTAADAIGMITANVQHPHGYGRIKRDEKQNVIGIVEEKDATPKERAITEVNSGLYFIPAGLLKKWLPTLTNHNAQKEYYLTDIFRLAANENIVINTVQPAQREEINGVNDRAQLAVLERAYQLKAAEKFMRQGVTLLDPARFDVRGDVQIGRDVVIDINVILEGKVVIGDGCRIGENVTLRDAELGKQIEVKANSMIDGAKIHDHCVIGPFARIRPETTLAAEVHIGNFVEIKKSHIAQGSKVNHLSYIGDSEIGKQVNVGAGTITCNYDGVNKHKTIIRDHVFIGSDTQLVAPVTIGEGATIGAGSTITQDAPAHQLTLSRGKQQTIEGWTRKKKA